MIQKYAKLTQSGDYISYINIEDENILDYDVDDQMQLL